MRKGWRLFVITAGILVLLVGCTSVPNVSDPVDQPQYMDLNLLPEMYGVEMARENGDVVGVHGTAYNVEKLDRFIETIGNDTSDMVRITQYTIEGDAIIIDVVVDGEQLTLTHDNTRDKWGGERAIKHYQLTKISRKETKNEVFYDAQLNNGEIFSIFYLTQ